MSCQATPQRRSKGTQVTTQNRIAVQEVGIQCEILTDSPTKSDDKNVTMDCNDDYDDDSTTDSDEEVRLKDIN